MRDVTNGERLQKFLHRMGEEVQGPGTIYLVGGSSAVWEGWRETTIDVDLKAEPEPPGFFEAIARLKEEVGINVELAAPDQFIPPLPGWQERSPFLLKEGPMTICHYDFYAQALSKIERGHARDLVDVACMERRGLIEKGRLVELFRQIEPELIRYPAIETSRFQREVLAFVGNDF